MTSDTSLIEKILRDSGQLLFTGKQLEDYGILNRKTVRNRDWAGKEPILPAVRIGNVRKYRIDDVLRLIKK